MQLIVFQLKNLCYGISTETVEEITNPLPFRPVPKSPDLVHGVVNLRGDILTLINVYNLLNLDDFNLDDCYNNTIVAELGENNVALMVDEVIGVTEVEENSIQVVTENEKDYLRGFTHAYDQIVNILEFKNLF